MADWLIAIILGFVEGVTEFIPVSSTGHLLIAEHLLKLDPASFFRSDLFNVVVQAGAVLAVVPLFKDRLVMLSRWRERRSQILLAKIALAFFITAVGGVVLKTLHFKLPETVGPVAWALFLGGVAFIVVEKWLGSRLSQERRLSEDVTWTVAVVIGLAQLVAAIFPGTSRSGSTILFALMLGTTRVAATEFSFLVGIPSLLAAGALKIGEALLERPVDAPRVDWALLALGTAVAAVVSFIAVKWLLRFVQSHTFIGFGIYRIALAVILLLLLHEASPFAQ